VRDELLAYYERELTVLRRLGAEFAAQYPKVAGRLRLEESGADDPHVERLLEGFAFLAARIHLKLDDDFPRITEALLGTLYPHYLRPIPSMALVEFGLDPEQGKLTTGLDVPAGALLYARAAQGTQCKFRTCYPTTVWPVDVTAARWSTPDQLQPPVRSSDAFGALRLEFTCLPDVTFGGLALETLRCYLHGESGLVATLYEVLDNNTTTIILRDPDRPAVPAITLGRDALRPVGFDRDVGMLPYASRSLLAYRLLQEYFLFPEKYCFFDLGGFSAARAAGFGRRLEVVFLVSPFERRDRWEQLETAVTAQTFRLGCTPVVNLFPQSAEPITLHGRAAEYPVVPDARRRETVLAYAVEDVSAVNPGGAPVRFAPMYGRRFGRNAEAPEVFWHAHAQPSRVRADGTQDLYLAFVDAAGDRAQPPCEAVSVQLTCFNGDLPHRMPFGSDEGDFQLPGGGPIRRIMTLVPPTKSVPVPPEKSQLWQLVSQLSLNYGSLVAGGAEGLQELLRLQNTADSKVGEKHIQGIRSLRSELGYARLPGEAGVTLARGHRVELVCDEDMFAGGAVYLFASVLERFLGLFTSLNSFTSLAVRTPQRKEILREWPPRAGAKALL
jgi:type VI secretion system protein ImpG